MYRTVSELSQLAVQSLDTMRFSATVWGRGTTYDVHLGLIGKRVLDFLLVLIELFSHCVTAEALRTKIDRKLLHHKTVLFPYIRFRKIDYTWNNPWISFNIIGNDTVSRLRMNSYYVLRGKYRLRLYLWYTIHTLAQVEMIVLHTLQRTVQDK